MLLVQVSMFIRSRASKVYWAAGHWDEIMPSRGYVVDAKQRGYRYR